MSTVLWGRAMEGVGLTAILQTIVSPLEMPPRIPPALLVEHTTFPFCISKGSFIWLPVMVAALKPEPISTPLTAPIPIRAPARSQSSLSNTGSPRPGGTPRASISTIPPMLSLSSLACFTLSSMAFAASGSAQRTGFDSTLAFMSSTCTGEAFMPPSSTT